MRVDELVGFLREHWPVIREQLLTGAYRPSPCDGLRSRSMGEGCESSAYRRSLTGLCSRQYCRCCQPQWDPTFSESSFGFRPGRSAHQAVEHAQCAIVEGHRWVVDIDLESFFDRVNHDILMARVAKRWRTSGS